jgi:HlyD family secretion protein
MEPEIQTLITRPPTTTALAPARTLDVDASGDVREFMARPPHWLLRSGTTVLAVVLGVLLVLSIVIKYPDTIKGRVTVIGTQPVVEVVARQSGHLESLRVKEGQRVTHGEILAVIKNPSRPATVFALSEKLARLSNAMAAAKPVLGVEFGPEEELGKLQASYADFLHAYHQYESKMADDYTVKTGGLLREQLDAKRSQIESLRGQSELTRRELELARAKYDRVKVLHGGNMVSTADLQEQEMAYLAQMRSETMAQRALTEAQIEAMKMEKSLRDLEHERDELLLVAREELRAGLNKVRGEIDVWETEHVLRAPADGNVAFYDFWSDQQYVTAGRQVFLVVPETTRLLGRMPVSPGGAGKIRPGQRVRMRLDDFPYKEFGVVSGTVQSISMVARDGANLVLVDIPHPLVTSFHRKLQFKQEMTGEAQIVMEDIRLLGRVLYEIRRAFVNNTDG